MYLSKNTIGKYVPHHYQKNLSTNMSLTIIKKNLWLPSALYLRIGSSTEHAHLSRNMFRGIALIVPF